MNREQEFSLNRAGSEAALRPERRVLMISSRADSGGGPKHIYDLICNLPPTIEVFLTCPCEAPYWEKFVTRLGLENLLAIPHRRISLPAVLHLVKFMQRHQIDIIHSHGKGAGLYGRILSVLTKKTCIHTYHGIHLDEYNRVERYFYLAIERQLAKFTEFLIAVSDSEEQLVQELALCSPAKLAVIRNGVSLADSERIFERSAHFPCRVLTSSWFNKQKNSQLLIPIMKKLAEMNRLQDFSFVILGDGELRLQLEIQLRQLFPSLALQCPGIVADPGQYMRKADCFLSTSCYEGLPYAVLEAMSLSLPIVATDVIGNHDLVDHGCNGFLFPLGSPESAALSLVRLADDPALAVQMGTHSRLRIKTDFSLSPMVSEIAALYLRGDNGK